MKISRDRLDGRFTHRLKQTLMDSRWYLAHEDTAHLMGCILYLLRVDKDAMGKPKSSVFLMDEYLKVNDIDITQVFSQVSADHPIGADAIDILSAVYQISPHFSTEEIASEYFSHVSGVEYESDIFDDDNDAEQEPDLEIEETDLSYDDSIHEEVGDGEISTDFYDDTKIPWASIGLDPRGMHIPDPDTLLNQGIYAFDDGLLDDPVVGLQGQIYYYETATTHQEDSEEVTTGLHTFPADVMVTYGHLFASFYFLHMDASAIADIYHLPVDLVISGLQDVTARLQSSTFGLDE